MKIRVQAVCRMMDQCNFKVRSYFIFTKIQQTFAPMLWWVMVKSIQGKYTGVGLCRTLNSKAVKILFKQNDDVQFNNA